MLMVDCCICKINKATLKITDGNPKYKGKPIKDVVNADNGYCNWLLSNATEMDADLRHTIKHHMKEKFSQVS